MKTTDVNVRRVGNITVDGKITCGRSKKIGKRKLGM